MSDFALGSNLPGTLFQGLPNDELAAVNAYEVQDEINVVNNFRRKTIDGIDSLKNAIADVDTWVPELMADVSQLIATGDVDRIKSEGLSMLSGNIGRLMGDVAPGLLQSVTAGIVAVKDKTLEGIPLDSIMSSGTEILKSVSNIDLVNGMNALLDEVKDSEFTTGTIDLLSQSVMVGEMAAMSIELGVAEFVDPWVDMAHDSVKDVVWSRVGAAAILNSDLDTLNKSLDNHGSMFLDRYIGNPITGLLKNYKYKAEDSLEDSFGSLRSTLEKMDLKWDTREIGNSDLINLDVFKDLSEDAKIVMATNPVYRPVAQTANMIYEQPHKEVLADSMSQGTGYSREYRKALYELNNHTWDGRLRDDSDKEYYLGEIDRLNKL